MTSDGREPAFTGAGADLTTSRLVGGAYVGEGGVGEEREAFEQVLVVVVLDHRRPVRLKQKHVSDPRRCR